MGAPGEIPATVVLSAFQKAIGGANPTEPAGRLPRVKDQPKQLSSINRSNTRDGVPPLGLEPRTCGLKVRSSTN
jgi:hypothetical protein